MCSFKNRSWIIDFSLKTCFPLFLTVRIIVRKTQKWKNVTYQQCLPFYLFFSSKYRVPCLQSVNHPYFITYFFYFELLVFILISARCIKFFAFNFQNSCKSHNSFLYFAYINYRMMLVLFCNPNKFGDLES